MGKFIRVGSVGYPGFGGLPGNHYATGLYQPPNLYRPPVPYPPTGVIPPAPMNSGVPFGPLGPFSPMGPIGSSQLQWQPVVVDNASKPGTVGPVGTGTVSGTSQPPASASDTPQLPVEEPTPVPEEDGVDEEVLNEEKEDKKAATFQQKKKKQEKSKFTRNISGHVLINRENICNEKQKIIARHVEKCNKKGGGSIRV